VDRRYYNRLGAPKIKPDSETVARKAGQMKHDAFTLGPRERPIVEAAIKQVCDARGYRLFALNIRTNHVHLVVGSSAKPERMMDSFKAYSTRLLRQHIL
jgi:REP element-mobilizing transposase RayT